MRKGEAQRSVTTHGKPGDTPRLAFANHAILGFDERQELCEKKIAVAIMSVGGINKKSAAAFRCNHQEVADLVIAPQVLDQAPATALEQSLLVLSEPVQKIKNGILCLGVSLITRRQHDAIPHLAMENMTVENTAIDSSLRGGGNRQHANHRNAFDPRIAN